MTTTEGASRGNLTEDTEKVPANLTEHQLEIGALCKIAGLPPDLAAEFMAGKVGPIAEVRETILKRRVEQFAARRAGTADGNTADHDGDRADLETGFLPAGEPGAGAMNSPNRLIAAVKRRLAARGGKKGNT